MLPKTPVVPANVNVAPVAASVPGVATAFIVKVPIDGALMLITLAPLPRRTFTVSESLVLEREFTIKVPVLRVTGTVLVMRVVLSERPVLPLSSNKVAPFTLIALVPVSAPPSRNWRIPA